MLIMSLLNIENPKVWARLLASWQYFSKTYRRSEWLDSG